MAQHVMSLIDDPFMNGSKILCDFREEIRRSIMIKFSEHQIQ